MINIEPLIQKGAPVAEVQNIPEPGWHNVWLVVQNAPHPAAARVLLNFIMSVAGQQAYLQPNIGVSAISAPNTLPAPKQFYVADPTKTASNLASIRSTLGLPPLATS